MGKNKFFYFEWSIISRDVYSQMGNQHTSKDKKVTWKHIEEAKKEIHMVKRVYKDEEKKLDMGNRRNTDMKASRRVIFPLGRPVREEAKIETRIGIWKEVIQRYIRDKTEEGGKKIINLDKSQVSGRAKINKRIRSREIYVSLLDKGKGVVVMPLEMYTKIVETHTNKDRGET